MPVSTTQLALPTPVTADNNNIPADMLALANAIVASLAAGTFATRPTALTANLWRRYYATDYDQEYIVVTGPVWQRIGGLPLLQISFVFRDTNVNTTGEDLPPRGWILADGHSEAAAQTNYPDAWNVIPTAFKSGSAFVTPDLRGRIPMGIDNLNPWGSAQGAAGRLLSLDTIAEAAGSNIGTIFASNLPPHSHDISHTHTGTTDSDGAHGHVSNKRDNTGAATVATPGGVTAETVNGAAGFGNTGSVGAHDHGISTTTQSNTNSGNGPGSFAPISTVQDSLGFVPIIRMA